MKCGKCKDTGIIRRSNFISGSLKTEYCDCLNRFCILSHDDLSNIEWCINNMMIDLPSRTDLHEDEYNTPRYDVLAKLLEKVRSL